jgi:hypothetical protein
MPTAPSLSKSSARWAKRIERERAAALGATAGASELQAYFLIAAFLLSRAIMLFAVPTFLSDTGHYFDLARQIDMGRAPYREFVFEYPPLALFPIYFPQLLQRLFGSDGLYGYQVAHWSLFCLFDCAVFALALRRARSGSATLLGVGCYIAGGLLLAELFYDRYDMLMGATVFLAVAWALEGRPARSGAALAAGGLLKLIPLALAPFFLLDFWRRSAGRKALWPWAAAAIGGSVAGAIGSYAVFGDSLLSFLEFHRRRGIQIESVWSSLQWAANAIAPSSFSFPALELNYGAMHLAHASDALDFFAGTMPLAAIGGALAVAALASSPPRLGRVIFLALLGMIACGKVLSPQYLAWPVCVAPLAGLEHRRGRDVAFAAAFLAVVGLTAYEFHHYFDLIRMDDDAWLAVAVRNIALAGLAIALAIDMAKKKTSVASALPPARRQSARSA